MELEHNGTNSDINNDTAANLPVQAELCRVVQCEISGGLKNFEAGGHGAASWSVQNGKLSECFGIKALMDHAVDEQAAKAMLSRVMVKEITVLEMNNQHPVAVGVTCSICPSNEVTSNGEQYAITCPAKSYKVQPETIFVMQTDSEESSRWRQMYPQYNASNLETMNVLNVTGQAYVFVDQNHPVIQLLRDNAEVLNADISGQPLIDNRWYKMTRQVLSSCCATLRQKVLNNSNTQDLNALSIQIHRLHAQDWTQLQVNDELLSHVPDEVLMRNDEKEIAQFIEHLQTKRNTFSCRLQIKYEVFK